MSFSLTGTLFHFLLTALETVGIPGLFALMVVESFGIPPLPSEIILPLAGVLLVEGVANFTWPIILVAAVGGSLVGSFLAYYVGRWGGPALVRRWGGRFHIHENDIARAEKFFERYGAVTIGGARLVPLLRAYISYPAGAAQVPPWRFGLYTFAGAVPFITLMVYLGTVLGHRIGVIERYFQFFDVVVIVILVAVAFYLLGWLRARDLTGGAPPDPPT
ncbi:MAG: DedA family protein [Thermoplasmata archaeon]|nr:DedA family protein [Thermoplasmata archaeon]